MPPTLFRTGLTAKLIDAAVFDMPHVQDELWWCPRSDSFGLESSAGLKGNGHTTDGQLEVVQDPIKKVVRASWLLPGVAAVILIGCNLFQRSPEGPVNMRQWFNDLGRDIFDFDPDGGLFQVCPGLYVKG